MLREGFTVSGDWKSLGIHSEYLPLLALFLQYIHLYMGDPHQTDKRFHRMSMAYLPIEQPDYADYIFSFIKGAL